MERARSATLYAAIAVLLAASVYSLYAVFSTPFSDEAITASLVDTWEASALATSVALVVIGVIALLSVALAYPSGSARVRRLGTVAVLLSMSSGALLFYGHVVLSERTAQLTGHSFGSLYGLF